VTGIIWILAGYAQPAIRHLAADKAAGLVSSHLPWPEVEHGAVLPFPVDLVGAVQFDFYDPWWQIVLTVLHDRRFYVADPRCARHEVHRQSSEFFTKPGGDGELGTELARAATIFPWCYRRLSGICSPHRDAQKANSPTGESKCEPPSTAQIAPRDPDAYCLHRDTRLAFSFLSALVAFARAFPPLCLAVAFSTLW
jgi:hypothetical protein